MARFRNLQHHIAVEPIAQVAGFSVERVRRFDHTALLPELERWSHWAFRITLGGMRFVSYETRSCTLAPTTILWHAPLRGPVKLRALPGTSTDQIVLRLNAQFWNHWIALQPGFADRHAALFTQPPQPVFALQIAPPQVLLIIRDLLALNEALQRPAQAIERQCTLLLHLIGGLHFERPVQDFAPERRQRVEAAQAYLARDLSQPPSLHELATALNVGPRQLQRDFLACTGLTPRRFLNIMRLSEANALLADTSLPIATIAAQLGYVSQTHFSTAFKQVYQCSPREVRAALHGHFHHTHQLIEHA